jgi:mannan endo-1,4-beta-mannosidase
MYLKSDTTGTCTTITITNWVKEISASIKSINYGHLVAIGDEGFYNKPHAVPVTEPYQRVLFSQKFQAII